MNNLHLLNEIKERLLSEFPGIIEKVILFGSQVMGNATENSDHDILIVVNIDYDWKFKNKIYDFNLKYNILTDIKLISLNELNTIKVCQPFVLEAIEHGIIV
jgi:predicted nucleotidyltransferase